MNRFLVAASLIALWVLPALAGDDPMAGFYGNTIVSSGGGVEFHSHYRADHTFDLVGTMMLMSHTFNGTWAVDGKGNICRSYIGEAPPGTANPNCAPLVPRKVGDRWMSKDATRTLTLKAGVL
jgi:hypothetical protein